MTLRIRPASVDDAPQLSRFAARVFNDTFAKDNSRADMEIYAASAFAPDIQAGEIRDPAATILLAEQIHSPGELDLVGYAFLSTGEAPAAISGASPIELRRFYVASKWHGRGVAHQLMDATLEMARTRGGRTLWLGVWERNLRAIAFYRKLGFERVGEYTFMLGNDPQTDWLLQRPLAARNS